MDKMTFSYFPGCSLATTAKENNDSLINFAKDLGITLKELDDWNCCGSSSAHSIDHTLADQLARRRNGASELPGVVRQTCSSEFAHHALF